MTGNTIGCVFLTITKPAGGGTVTDSTCSSSYNSGLTLTTTGTHTLKVNPQDSRTGRHGGGDATMRRLASPVRLWCFWRP